MFSNIDDKFTVAYDTETTGLNLNGGDEMFAYSTCNFNGIANVKRVDGSDKRKIKNRDALEKFFARKNRAIVCHNTKFDLTASENFLGKDLSNKVIFHDTIIQSHILQNHHPTQRLKDLAWELCGISKDDEKAVKEFLKKHPDLNYSHVPEEVMNEYQHFDAVRCMLLHRFFYPKIKANKDFHEIYKAEMDLIPPTIAMEKRGMMLDIKKTRKLILKLEHDVNEVLNEIERTVGERLNPNKPGHIQKMLFDHAGLPIIARTPKSKQPKTNKETLEKLREINPHPVLDMILKYRSWVGGIASLESYIDFADSDGIIHPSVNTCKAKTSRESSENPNLQNVQKEGVLLNPFPVPARTVFRPRPGYVNFHVDYSGIEMRLLIYYSREPILLKVLNEFGDPHNLAAEIFYGDDYRNATGAKKKTLRGAAKNMNFGIPYGAGEDKVSAGLGLSPEIGAQRYQLYKQTLPGLVGLSQKFSRMVRDQGFVKTTFGRVLHLPRNMAYMGTNYVIQGTAAGILKRAQPRVHKYLEQATGGEAGILLPIHDELVIEYPRNRLKDVHEILGNVRKLMIDFPEFDIPFEVDFEVATVDWAHKKEFKIAA